MSNNTNNTGAPPPNSADDHWSTFDPETYTYWIEGEIVALISRLDEAQAAVEAGRREGQIPPQRVTEALEALDQTRRRAQHLRFATGELDQVERRFNNRNMVMINVLLRWVEALVGQRQLLSRFIQGQDSLAEMASLAAVLFGNEARKFRGYVPGVNTPAPSQTIGIDPATMNRGHTRPTPIRVPPPDTLPGVLSGEPYRQNAWAFSIERRMNHDNAQLERDIRARIAELQAAGHLDPASAPPSLQATGSSARTSPQPPTPQTAVDPAVNNVAIATNSPPRAPSPAAAALAQQLAADHELARQTMAASRAAIANAHQLAPADIPSPDDQANHEMLRAHPYVLLTQWIGTVHTAGPPSSPGRFSVHTSSSREANPSREVSPNRAATPTASVNPSVGGTPGAQAQSSNRAGSRSPSGSSGGVSEISSVGREAAYLLMQLTEGLVGGQADAAPHDESPDQEMGGQEMGYGDDASSSPAQLQLQDAVPAPQDEDEDLWDASSPESYHAPDSDYEPEESGGEDEDEGMSNVAPSSASGEAMDEDSSDSDDSDDDDIVDRPRGSRPQARR